MTILFVIYLIFLISFLIFNGYMIMRLLELRIKGDRTRVGIVIYSVCIGFIIMLSFILIIFANWSLGVSDLFGGI